MTIESVYIARRVEVRGRSHAAPQTRQDLSGSRIGWIREVGHHCRNRDAAPAPAEHVAEEFAIPAKAAEIIEKPRGTAEVIIAPDIDHDDAGVFDALIARPHRPVLCRPQRRPSLGLIDRRRQRGARIVQHSRPLQGHIDEFRAEHLRHELLHATWLVQQPAQRRDAGALVGRPVALYAHEERAVARERWRDVHDHLAEARRCVALDDDRLGVILHQVCLEEVVQACLTRWKRENRGTGGPGSPIPPQLDISTRRRLTRAPKTVITSTTCDEDRERARLQERLDERRLAGAGRAGDVEVDA